MPALPGVVEMCTILVSYTRTVGYVTLLLRNLRTFFFAPGFCQAEYGIGPARTVGWVNIRVYRVCMEKKGVVNQTLDYESRTKLAAGPFLRITPRLAGQTQVSFVED